MEAHEHGDVHGRFKQAVQLMRLSKEAFAKLQESRDVPLAVASDTLAKRVRRPSVKSRAEEAFALILKAWMMPEPVREHRFHPERRWRFDFAWPEDKVAVEIEGIVWSEGGGRHQRGKGFEADCLKYLSAMDLGWRIVRIPSTWLDGGYGEAMGIVERVLNERLRPF